MQGRVTYLCNPSHIVSWCEWLRRVKQIKSPFLNYQQVSLSLINGWYFFQPSTYNSSNVVIIQKWNVHNQCSSIIYYYILSETLIFASNRISFHNYLCRHAKIASNLRFDSSRQIFNSTQSLWEWETKKFIYIVCDFILGTDLVPDWL